MEPLGSLERLDAREVWKDEARDFTPWLRDNIHLLGQALGLDIDVDVRREVAVGLFSADLLGIDVATNAPILIENQLEETDHRHLGQLLTYAGGLESQILVWVAPRMREEHRQALIWLNQSTREDVLVFGVEIELLRIDGSKPAPHFKVVVAPNEWQKAKTTRSAPAGRTPSERGEKYREFWRAVLSEILVREPNATTASPERVPTQSWYGLSLGRTGFLANLAFAWEGSDRFVRCELYLDVGDGEQNEAIFDLLASEREQIEAEFGEPLEWDRRPNARHCRIFVRRSGTIDDDPEVLEDVKDWGVDRLLQVRRVFGPRARRITLPLPVESAHA